MFKKALILSLMVGLAWGAGKERLPVDELNFGKSTSSDPKEIVFNIGAGASNPSMSISSGSPTFVLDYPLSVSGSFSTTGDFSTTGNISGANGTFTGNLLTLGDGTDQDVSILVDRTANDPFIKWDDAAGAWVFSNDGLLEKKIGSGSGGGEGGINLLANASFEDPGSPILNWTCSGGTFTQEGFTNGLEDDQFFARYVSTGAGQYCESDVVTIPEDFSAGLMADVRYTSGSSAFDLVVLDNTGAITYTSGSFSDLDEWRQLPTQTFDSPGSGSLVKLRVVSTGAGTIDLNRAYLGSNKGIIPADFQGEIVEKILSSSFTSTGSIAPIPELSFTGLEIGATYEVGGSINSNENINESSGGYVYFYNGPTLLAAHQFQINSPVDGAYGKPYLQPSFKFIASDTTFNVSHQGYGVSPVTIYGDGTKGVLGSYIQLTKLSTKSVQAFTPEQASFYYEGEIQHTTGGFSLPTNAPVNSSINDANLSLVNRVGSAGIACDGGEVGSGSTCTGLEDVGIAINLPVAGRYRVCNTNTFKLQAGTTGGGASQTVNTKIVKTENASSTILVDSERGSRRRTGNGSYASANVLTTTQHQCEIYDIANAGLHTFRLYYISSGGGAGISLTFQTSSPGSANYMNAWRVELVGNYVARPVIQNMVDTRESKGLRTQTCTISDTGTPTFQTSDCNSWIDSISDNGTGTGILNLKAGTFSEKPSCQFNGQSTNSCFSHGNTAITPSSVPWINVTCSTIVQITSEVWSVTCTGKR